MSFNRRSALLGLGLAAASPALGNAQDPTPAAGLHFAHGVASGDPLADRVILWTRISGATNPVTVTWQVARDDAFADIAASGSFATDADRDFTVKVDAAGLEPGHDYFYRFQALDVTSPVGRTRTLPQTADQVVLAVASCSLHPNGYFNAYRAIAQLDQVDAVVHLGDYIYEYGAAADDYGMVNGRALNRIPEPPHEMVALSDYRARHAQYKADPDLQAAHARAPWICVFDDHEITNDCWISGAENHNSGEGDFMGRKAVALKAYGEWMPIRDATPGKLREAIYRSFRFGNMAELIMTETRLVGRTEQMDYEKELMRGLVPDFNGIRTRINDPARELLGADQRAWLSETLTASVRDGVRWQVLGNQVVMARSTGPDLVAVLGAERVKAVMETLTGRPKNILRAILALFSRPDPFPMNLDAWDGYPAERERLYNMIRSAGARTVVVSGDSHNAWANNLSDASGTHVAVELGVTSITSPTRWLDAWLPDLEVAKAVAERNPEILACADDHNGFVRLTLTAERMTGEWMAVNTVISRDFKVSVRNRFEALALDSGVGPLVEV